VIFNGTTRPQIVFSGTGPTPLGEFTWWGTDLIEWSTMRGRRTRYEPLTPGTMQLVFDNRAGTYDNASKASQLSMMMNCPDLTQYNVFLSWPEQVKQIRGTNPVTVFTGRDVLYRLQETVVSGAFLNANSGETVDARMTRLAGLVSAFTTYDAMTHAGTTPLIASFGNTNVLTAMQQCANVELGYFHARSDAVIALTNLYARIGGTTKLQLSDTTGANLIPFQNLVIVPGFQTMVNAVGVSRPSRSTSAGQITWAAYNPDIALWGRKEQHWEAPCNLDASAEAIGAYLARTSSTPADFVSMVEIAGVDALRNATTLTYNDILALDIGDRVSVTRSGTTYDSIVEGIQHVATTLDWKIRLYLSPYTAYSADIATGLATTPGTGTFVYGTPTDWTITAATDTVRVANSLDIKWRDFSDRGAAIGTLDLYANAKQEVVYDANSTGAYQFNLKGGSATAMTTTLDVGQCVVFDILVKCNNTAHKANAVVLVDGVSTGVTTIWLGGAPAAGTVGGWDRYKVKVYYVNNTPTYRVVARREASA